MNKCIGCGATLQNNNIEDIGYTSNINNSLCERCFRIRNYNEYKLVTKSNDDYINILNNISNTNDLVLLVVDIFNISKNLNDISKYIKNDILLVLTKRDILPKSCYDEKLKDYFKNYNLNIIDTVIISSKKNYNLDELYEKINNYKKSKKVYIVGFTNSGKSTLINKIIYNYSDINLSLTTSNLPSTTIDLLEIKVEDDLILVDTPGLLDDGDIINYIDSSMIKKIIPNKEIRPINYQVKTKQVFIVDDLFRLDICDNTNITFYISNNLKINRYYKDNDTLKNLKKYSLDVSDNSDIVIQGLGFIKVTTKTNINIYIKDGIRVFVRKNLI